MKNKESSRGLGKRCRLISLAFLSLLSISGCGGQFYGTKSDIVYSREKGFYDKRSEFMDPIVYENSVKNRENNIRKEFLKELNFSFLYRF